MFRGAVQEAQTGKVILAVHGAGYAGTERHVRSLAVGLRRRGWNTDVVSSMDGPLLDSARAAGIPTHLVRRTSTASYLANLIRIFREIRPGLVHTHSGLIPGLAARWAGVGGVIETRHGLPGRMSEIPGRAAAIRPGERWSWRIADLTLAVCAADAEWLMLNLGMSSGRIKMITNGLPRRMSDPEDTASTRSALRGEWGADADTLVLGFIGRLREEKAPERLIELLARLDGRACDDAPRCLLVIAGEGPDEALIRSQASALHLEQRIRWLGVVPDAPRILPGIDHLLLPSLYEGMPYVVLEALQAGVPVLATPVGGLPEVMGAGVLADGLLPWGPREWGGRILRMWRDHRARLDWCRAAVSRADDFDEERMLDEIEMAYRSVIGGRKNSSRNAC